MDIELPSRQNKDRVISERGDLAELLRYTLIDSKRLRARAANKPPGAACSGPSAPTAASANTSGARRGVTNTAPFPHQSRPRVSCRFPIRCNTKFYMHALGQKPNVFADFQSISETKDPLISV